MWVAFNPTFMFFASNLEERVSAWALLKLGLVSLWLHGCCKYENHSSSLLLKKYYIFEAYKNIYTFFKKQVRKFVCVSVGLLIKIRVAHPVTPTVYRYTEFFFTVLNFLSSKSFLPLSLLKSGWWLGSRYSREVLTRRFWTCVRKSIEGKRKKNRLSCQLILFYQMLLFFSLGSILGIPACDRDRDTSMSFHELVWHWILTPRCSRQSHFHEEINFSSPIPPHFKQLLINFLSGNWSSF